MRRSTLHTISLLAHVGVALALGGISVREKFNPTPIELVAAPPPPPPPKAPTPAPSPAPEAPKPRVQQRAKPSESPSTPEPAKPGLGAMPDFGLAMSGGVALGDVGIAIPAAMADAPVERLVVPKQVTPTAPAQPQAPRCRGDETKPIPLSVPRPSYPDTALRGGAEGRVRIRLTIDEHGQVVDAALLQRVRDDLDEAALAAARRARFSPALRCGKAVTGTFTVAMRFSAG